MDSLRREVRFGPPDKTTYALDLSGVSTREQMESWDANWISEFEDEWDGYEFQVDPGNGGQVGVWTGSGNPSTSPTSLYDYSQFIAAGPDAGQPIRIRMLFEYQTDGAWVSFCHYTDNPAGPRKHYEIGYQDGNLGIYKFWGPSTASDWALVATDAYTPSPGTNYWIYATETRVGNAVDGNVTITGQMLDTNFNVLAEVSIQDTGSLAGQALIDSTNKRGFGGFFQADGTGCKILEWIVEAN